MKHSGHIRRALGLRRDVAAVVAVVFLLVMSCGW